jgi:hypothetical protein
MNLKDLLNTDGFNFDVEVTSSGTSVRPGRLKELLKSDPDIQYLRELWKTRAPEQVITRSEHSGQVNNLE